MAEKRVSELNSASSINLSDLFLLAQDLGQGEYDSLNVSASVLATWLASQVQFPLLLTYTTAKDIIGAINEVAQSGGGGGGGGSTVYLGTTIPTSSQGNNADLYVKYTAGTPNVVDALYVKISGAWSEIETGGGTGATDLDDLSDVALSSPSNGQVLKYNSTTGKWENANESGGGGTSSYFVIEVEDNQSTGYLEVVTSADDILDAVLHDVPIVATYGNTTYTIMNVYEQTGGGSITLTFVAVSSYHEDLITLYGFSIYLTESQGVWSVSADVNEVSNDIKIPKVYTRTLTAGNTSITISADVRSSSLIDVYTDTWGVNPTNVVADTTNDTITLTFAARSSDLDVKVEVIY